MNPVTLIAIVLASGLSTGATVVLVRPRPSLGRGLLAWLAGAVAILALGMVFNLPGINVPPLMSLLAFSIAGASMSGIVVTTQKMWQWSIVWTFAHMGILVLVPILLG